MLLNKLRICVVAVELLTKKISTYEQFNTRYMSALLMLQSVTIILPLPPSYPGFGGFMPWVVIGQSGVVPDAPYWSNQVA
jgi:hypothetical protein